MGVANASQACNDSGRAFARREVAFSAMLSVELAEGRYTSGMSAEIVVVDGCSVAHSSPFVSA